MLKREPPLDKSVSGIDSVKEKLGHVDSLDCIVGNERYMLQMKELTHNTYLFSLNNERTFNVEICSDEEDVLLLKCNGKYCKVFWKHTGKNIHAFYNGIFRRVSFTSPKKNLVYDRVKSQNDITAQMPSIVIKVLVTKGQMVKMGDEILVLESMKIYNTLTASCDGQVKSILVKEGETVAHGQLLIEIETSIDK